MIDFARITATAGNGGNGSGSFHHMKGKRLGKADGGDGGRGGNVYLVASTHLNTLEPFRFVKDYKARDGVHGLSKHCTGAVGADLEIKVPYGTLVRVKDGVNYDIVEGSQKILIARGGEGGRGNSKLRDEYGRRPYKGEAGQIGETVELELELKLIADVGLVGLPNAGKSTLVSKFTSARPKIADYPFTTLEPNLGVMNVGETGKKLVIADIPGLIEGASEGKGLGDLFLRHIERTRMIVHVIDITSGDVWTDYQTIRGELKVYSKDLAKKKEIIVLNKADLDTEVDNKVKIDIFKKKRKRVFLISAQSGEGLDQLKGEIISKFTKLTS